MTPNTKPSGEETQHGRNHRYRPPGKERWKEGNHQTGQPRKEGLRRRPGAAADPGQSRPGSGRRGFRPWSDGSVGSSLLRPWSGWCLGPTFPPGRRAPQRRTHQGGTQKTKPPRKDPRSETSQKKANPRKGCLEDAPPQVGWLGGCGFVSPRIGLVLGPNIPPKE